jgi:hypothetical protein
MAPLSRPALLAALVLAPAAVFGQTEADALARMRALKESYKAEAQRPADAAPAVDPAKLADSKALVAKARIEPEKLGWTDQNIADLGPAIRAASLAVEKLHEENPSNVSATFYGNGTMVNLEESIKAATHLWGGSDFKRGCVSHQNVTLNAVAKVLSRTTLEFHGISVLRKVSPHHAVIVFPMGTDWRKTGVIFDGWIHQESAPDRMTFTFPDWFGAATFKAELE